MTIDYRVGDVRALLAEIPDGTVSLVATSPPFIALRSYLPADHPDKHLEIGSEPDPATFIDTLLGLTAEWGRVLAPWGSIAIELGDTYAGSGESGWERTIKPEHRSAGRMRGGVGDGTARDLTTGGWPRAKCLALVPQLYAASLAYGRNLLTGQPSPAGQWLVRNVIVWHRPNPAVGALGDKARPSTSYIVVATRSPKRWFDLTAVRGDPSPNTHARTARGVESRPSSGKSADRDGNYDTLDTLHSTAGAPPLDCWFDEHDTWTITTQPSRLAHFAMWPPKLAERLVLMMCPREVCRVCGEPRRRIERTTNAIGKAVASRNAINAHPKYAHRTDLLDVNKEAPDRSERETLGWTSCPCADYRPGVVLDPFAGTFTTGLVAEYHGRDAIGIDLDPRNAELVPARREEVRRALNPTHVRTAEGQLTLLDERSPA